MYPGSKLCVDDIHNLKKWTPQVVSTLANNLTPQGYKDAYYLAKRYKSRFPTLLNQPYDPKKFEVSIVKIHVSSDLQYNFL
jgi:hypothetical protein